MRDITTAKVLARFRVERQVLAKLTHPNITRLLDGGIDDSGRPYLVMQYVEGLPITQFCDKHALSIDERLVLFQTVCSAVQHAHRNLIVHRDLKPSNILITEDGEVKLLDFGIAKLLNPDWEMSVALTRSQVRLMTPEYAAPEQVRGHSITTATDVYALGVLLYEILSGRRPYKLRNRVQAEIERIICEVSPTRPSTAITELEEGQEPKPDTSPEAVSRARRTGVNRLKKTLQGDLDNIVLMALRKEPTRRYSSAEQFSEDIERYRKGMPVQAQKDALSYRMKKFVSRHRIAVALSTISILLLIGFSLFTVYQGRLLKAERDSARIEKTRADQVIGLLVSLFETANPNITPGGDTLQVGEFVERGAEKTLESVKDDPELSIIVNHTFGRMYAAQGKYREGYTLLEEAYVQQESRHGKYDTTTTAYLHELGNQAYRLGDKLKAREMFADLLERNKQIFGPSHHRVAMSMQNVALTSDDPDEQRSLLESSLAIKRELLPANHIDIAAGLNQLAIHHYYQKACDQSVVYYREAIDILEEILDRNHPNILAVMGNMANCLKTIGNNAKAIETQRDVIARLKEVARDTSVQASNAWNNLGVFLTDEGSFEEAEQAFRHAHGVQQHLLGENHPRVVSTARSLAIILNYLGREDEGLPLMESALKEKEKRVDQDGELSFGVFKSQYAILLFDAGRSREAIQPGKEGLEILKASADEEDPELIAGQLTWSLIMLANGNLEEAESFGRLVLEKRTKILEADNPEIAQAECIYGVILSAQGKHDEARAILSEAVPQFAAWPKANPKWITWFEKELKLLDK